MPACKPYTMLNMSEFNLQNLQLRNFIAGFRAESAALWLLCIYIFFEYIRPQDMYPVLDILPWGQLFITACLLSVFFSRSVTKANGLMPLDTMFILFSMLVILSGIFAWSPEVSFKQWKTYASWMILYFCAVSILTTPRRIILFTLFFIIINFKLSQHGARTFAMRGFTFAGWGLAGSPGWFSNSGEFSMQMVIMFSISISILVSLKKYIANATRWWLLVGLFPVTAALSVIGSSSRGGQLALAAVILAYFFRGRHLLRKSLILIAIVFIGYAILPDEQIARFSSMGDDETSELRLTHWRHALEVLHENPLGIGYENWIPYYEMVYQPISVEQIHNTILEAFVELGYPGGMLFIIMLITTFMMNARTRQEMLIRGDPEGDMLAAIAAGVNLGLLGAVIAGMFMSVLFYPMFWLAFAMSSALRHISVSTAVNVDKSQLPVTGSPIRL